ncbi:17671_t:CDS:2, partial [Gigaspora margarita]
HQSPENEHMNLLDILTDVKTSTIYPTINLINPYIDLPKNFFALYKEAEEIFDTYLDLIYGSESVNNNENDTNFDNNYELPLDNINTVENLLLVNTTGILQKVCTAIFLSLDELWSVLSDILLIITFLNSRFKDFEWYNGKGKAEAESIVQELYYDMNILEDDNKEFMNETEKEDELTLHTHKRESNLE